MNERPVIKIDSRVWVPDELMRTLSDRDRGAFRREVVVRPKSTRWNPTPDSVVCYQHDACRKLTGLPYRAGLQLIANRRWHERAEITDATLKPPSRHGHNLPRE